MKKILTALLLGFIVLTSTSCFKRDAYEDIAIYTTTYPIEYLVNTLYGTNSTVTSIYPSDTDTDNYSLTDKQISKYSKGDIFVYNGLSNEKEIAKSLINKNSKLKIIDVSYGLKYYNGVEELWMAPNNYLMLATTVKNNLENFITSKYIDEEIDNNYKDLEEKISIIDAELRSIGNAAKEKNNNIIITSNNMFKYLNDYGFNVISLEDESYKTDKAIENITDQIKAKKYKYILMDSNDEENELIASFVKAGIKVIKVSTMNTLTDEQKNNNDNYLTIMNDYIDQIKSIVL